MRPGLNVNISAGTIASMTDEQFRALRDNICAEGRWESINEPIHVSETGDYIGVNLPNIFIGIEKDGYTHS
jgi:hypothetical protein